MARCYRDPAISVLLLGLHALEPSQRVDQGPEVAVTVRQVEPEVSEHVARAKANHPKGEVRWRGALILPHEGLRQLQEPELREHVARARPR